ncbi:MAG: hypothetical protein VW270_09600 [Candidatus Poseidoniales archaeon]
MPFNVNNLVSAINKSGVAKTSHFEVQVTGAGDTNLENSMMARVDTIDLPGRSLATVEHKFTNYGPINKVPYGGQIYGDITMSIILSEDMREKEYFEVWQNEIVNTGAFDLGVVPQNALSKFNTKYFDNYLGVVTIRQYGSAGDLRSIYTLNEAYPLIINPISMSWAEDDVAKLSVTMAYRNYQCVFQKQNQPGLGFGFSFNIGPNGISGSARIPGIGQISGNLGGGLKTVNARIGNTLNRVANIRRSF